MELSKGEKTRLRIIEAATELIFVHGFYSVTFAQIAKMAKLTHPAIYNHFDSMDDLLIESALHWSAEAKTFIDEGVSGLDSAKDQLKAIIERNILFPSKNRKKDALLLGLYYYSIGSKKAMTAYNQIKESGLTRFHILIEQGNREKCWSVNNPREAAYSIHSLLVGEVFKFIIRPNDEKTERIIKRCWSNVLAILS